MADTKGGRTLRALGWILGIGAGLALGAYLALQVSPWPAALLIRRAFERNARAISAALAPHMPAGVLAGYARILAAHGYTVVGVDYALAPAHTYPTPVRQTNSALGHLQTHAAPLHVDPSRLVLAGDSGGAHIVAQLANLITSAAYAPPRDRTRHRQRAAARSRSLLRCL